MPVAGSPPRVRGKAFGLYIKSSYFRITPACAGKRLVTYCGRYCDRDHPRVCGEKCKYLSASSAVLGSPPRVRGKGKSILQDLQRMGITPACAGKSARLLWEHFENMGSPPRVRGKDDRQQRRQIQRGITPACAGKRLKRSHSIGHFSCILCLFHSVLHRASVSGGSRAGPCAPPCLPAQNAVPV